MLYDDKYRAWVVKQVKDPMVRSFWENEFANYDRSFRQEVVGPIQNKVGQIFLAPALRNVLGMASEVKVGRARWNAFDRGESGVQAELSGAGTTLTGW